MRALFFFILLLITSIVDLNAQQNTEKSTVYLFKIREDIDPLASRKANRALREAKENKADLVVLHLNTYGGLVTDADSIRTLLLNSPIPVFVWIENNAASAGALISIACNKIFMNKGASIGAATVVEGTGNAAPDKYQSYFRSKMRATAEARGRNPQIAEAMVDGNKVVPGLNDSGNVVTLTTQEAIKWGFCDGEYLTINEMLKGEGFEQAVIIEQEELWMDDVMGFVLHPGLRGILVLLILGGIYYELRSPGIGFPLLVSIIASLLYFAPLYLEGLAENWEILLFIAGLGLLAAEIFVIPGFGIAGISGLILLFTSLVISATNNIAFDFSGANPEQINQSLLSVVLGLFGFIFLAILSGKGLADSYLMKKFALQESILSKTNTENNQQSLVGATGEVFSELKPHGQVVINGKRYEASSHGKLIEAGVSIVVVKQSGSNLTVKELVQSS